MKPFIQNVVRFALFAAAAYLALLVVWGELAPRCLQRNLNYLRGEFGHLLSRLQEAKQSGPVDILVVGSSHAYRGFDPRIFAQRRYSAFILGSSAQTPMHSYILLQRYVDRLRPRLVIWEVYPATFTIDGVEATLDLIANDEHDLFTRQLVRHHRHLAVYHNYLFSRYRRLTGIDRRVVENPVKGEDTYVPGGYVEGRIKYNPSDPRLRPAQRTWKFLDSHFEALGKAIDFLRARNIPVVLVQAPITSQLRNAYANNEAFDRRIAPYGPHIDFNGLVELDDHLHFLDTTHLNQDGVRLFNGVLLDRLQADRLLPPALPATDEPGPRREEGNAGEE